MNQTKRFILWLYGALYLATALSLIIVEYTSIKISWPWLSTLVMPMGIVFLCVNVPLASFAVLKVGHKLYLHGREDHAKTMRRIEQIRQTPLPLQSLTVAEIEDDNTPSHGLQTGKTPLVSQSVSHNTANKTPHKEDTLAKCNAAVAYALVDNPTLSIRAMARQTGYDKSMIGRTNEWQNR